MKTYAFIFARGGSKGIPGKNILPFAGKPMLAWSIQMAKSIPEIERVFVSTEDNKITRVAREYGAELIERPAELAQDDTSEWLAWQHAVKQVQENIGDFDKLISLPTTSPLRNSADVLACLSALDEQTDTVVTITETSRRPWFNMVKIDDDGTVCLLVEGNNFRRQDGPEAYYMTTVAYVARPSFILNHNRIWESRVRGVKIPPERAIDIDTPLDFKIAEFLMQEKLRKRKLKDE